ncbi:hypothetical protein BDW71DRAFT_180626 [Aspergillus fruticulosus]
MEVWPPGNFSMPSTGSADTIPQLLEKSQKGQLVNLALGKEYPGVHQALIALMKFSGGLWQMLAPVFNLLRMGMVLHRYRICNWSVDKMRSRPKLPLPAYWLLGIGGLLELLVDRPQRVLPLRSMSLIWCVMRNYSQLCNP